MRQRKRTRASKGYVYLGSAARVKASRRRLIRRVLALVGLAVILSLVGYGASVLLAWAGESDVFVLKEIHVLGNRHLGVATVAAAARIEPGVNLLRVSPEEVEKYVSSIPQVKRAFVQRRLPDELVIRVAERVPCFLVNCGCVWLVDREGVVVGPGTARDVECLFMATGFSLTTGNGGSTVNHGHAGEAAREGRDSVRETKAGEERVESSGSPTHLEPGFCLNRRTVDRILETIRSIEKNTPDLCRLVSEICLTPEGDLVVFTSDPPHRVTFGRERPLAESLVALGPVLGDLSRRGLKGMEVDLRFKRQLVVRASEERVAMREES